jgi:hypothetical protein
MIGAWRSAIAARMRTMWTSVWFRRTATLYVATGDNVWGILNAPATAEALAELIADGAARSTDLTPFDPMRLKPLDPSLLRSS